jgi:serine phosphatase RsbU (regulator of sigma subunit)
MQKIKIKNRLSKPGFTLRFPKDIEEIFYEHYFKISLRATRLALVLAAILYSLFGFLDILVAPSSKYQIWFIRYAVVIPFILTVFATTYFPVFKKIMQAALSATSLVMGLGIIGIMFISIDIETKFYSYAGLILIIIWSYTFVRLRFIYASAVSWVIVIIYELTAVFYHQMFSDPETFKIFMNNNFFYISANFLGMFVGYQIEFYMRRDFLNKKRLDEQHEELAEERDELRRKNEKMLEDLFMAKTIQRFLIPDTSGYDFIHYLYKPMEPIGGDFFDLIKFRDPEKIGIFISDVAGHGVPSALITSMLKSAILESGKYKSDPARLLYHLNNILSNLMDEYYVTALYGIYNFKELTFTYANAGHELPVVISKGTVSNLDQSGGIPLGIYNNYILKNKGISYNGITMQLSPSDKIVLFTDGLIDTKNKRKKERFSAVHKQKFLECSQYSSREFIDKIYRQLILYKGGDTFDDDICLICVDVW